MQIKIYKDPKTFTLVSSIKKADLDLLKKYGPDALKIKDEDGNDLFGISYVEGKHNVSKNGVTFGAVSENGGLMVVGTLPTLPQGQTASDYVADFVGAALANINKLEESVPAAVASIKEAREQLIGSITEA